MHGTVNGMGERAGNADLIQVALALEALYGVPTHLRLEQARALSRLVQERSGYELAPWKPVTGDNLFTRESGAVAAQFHDPPAIEPYASELVGAERGLVLGKKSGLDSIRIKAEELGLDLPEEARAEALAAVKRKAERKRGLVTDHGVPDDRAAGGARRRHTVSERVCVVGAGVIGSLFAGHLAQVADVCVLTRRREHADALNAKGLRVTGRSDLHARITASADPDSLPAVDLVIVATKATGLAAAAETLGGRFADAAVMTVLNGLGAEDVVRAHGDWPIISAVTFMSGTKHSDTHIEYILDTETWLGPYEETSFERVGETATLLVRAGLKAEALPDLRPAQWSKLIFNATVNSVAALTGLPHDAHFAARDQSDGSGATSLRPRGGGQGGGGCCGDPSP